MIYLDNAATSRKKPIPVLLSALKTAAFSANAGRGGHKAAIRTSLKIEKTREIIREKFFDGEVVFTKNCTEAINLVLTGLPLSGQIITTCFDHNSVLRTVKKLESAGKIRMKVISPREGGFLQPLEEALSAGDTSLVIMSGASNVTGKPLPIEELAALVKKKSKALFVLDAAQTAGHVSYDYKNVDILCASGHKGLLGLQGTGFALFRKNIVCKPLLTGGTGTSSYTIEIPKEVPEGLEAGTLNAVGIISLYYGVRHAFNHMERMERKYLRLRKQFLTILSEQKNIEIYDSDGSIVLCNVKGKSSEEIADELSAKGVYVRGGLHCAPLMHRYLGTGTRGAIRFSFGENNNFLQVCLAAVIFKKVAQKYE